MAVVDDSKELKVTPVTLAELASLNLGNVTIDVTADPYDYPPPPPWRVYLMQFNPASDNPIVKYNDGGIAYNMELRMVEKDEKAEYPGIVNYAPSPMNRKGQAISTAAYILVKAGVKLPDTIDIVKLLGGLDKWARSDKNILPVEINWRGYSVRQEKSVAYKMTDFPRNPDGTYNHVITVNGEEVRAKAFVNKIYPKGSDINALNAEIKKLIHEVAGKNKGGSGSGSSKMVVDDNGGKEKAEKKTAEIVVDDKEFEF